MTDKQRELINMIALLPEHETNLALNLVSYLLPDDVATPRDFKVIAEAETAFARGEYVRHEDIHWD